jgi:hypothetical protein
MDRRRLILGIDIAIKVALIGALLLAVAFPDLPQFEGKGIGARLAVYPLGALIVPGVWFAVGRFRGGAHGDYPYAADILITLPFAIDTLGNALDLFDTIDWWDDAMHYLNWALLMGGVGSLLLRLRPPLRPWALAGLIAGWGALAAVIWEVGEYFAFIRHSSELATAYTDTLGDLALGTLGGCTAALILYRLAWRAQPG